MLKLEIRDRIGKMNSFVRYFVDAQKNPILITVEAIAIAGVAAWFANFPYYAVVGIVVTASFFFGVSLVYALYKQKLSREELEIAKGKLEKKNLELEDKNKDLEKQVKIQPRLARYKQITTKIEIENSNGDAKFTNRYEIVNIGERSLTCLKHEMHWTGEPLNLQKVPGHITDNSVDFVATPYLIQDPSSEVSYMAKFKCYLINPIDSGKSSLYDWEIELKGTFKDAFTERKGRDSYDFTSSLPTDKFNIRIIAPDNYNFVPDLDVSVHNIYDMDDDVEKDRVKTYYRPTLNNQRKIVRWIVEEPKIAYKYTIKFTLEQT